MTLNFDISDFCISLELIPQNIADKILKWHLLPLQRTRNKLNKYIIHKENIIKIWVSKKSCWRPYKWEISHDRNGGSQHCFGEKKSGRIFKDAKGATDVTCMRMNCMLTYKQLICYFLLSKTKRNQF